MKITSKQGNGNKVHIYIDGEYTLTLYDDYWYLCGIKDGQEISETQLASLKEEAGFRSAYEKGITYLSMRAYSEKELDPTGAFVKNTLLPMIIIAVLVITAGVTFTVLIVKRKKKRKGV